VSDDTVDLPTPIVPGVARALSPLVRRIAVDLAGEIGPNTYLIGIDEIAVIDPGPDLDTHLDAIAGCGGDRIRWILSTGTGDQAGTKGLRERTGAEIVAVGEAGPADADEMVGADHTILGTEFRLVTMAAPTSSDARAMFFLEEERVLFAGDVVTDLDHELLADRRLRRLRAVAPAEGQLIERV
jgi:glyoxylase-like metal-dependent hydrolase (beta-lactamase superfamily II)